MALQPTSGLNSNMIGNVGALPPNFDIGSQLPGGAPGGLPASGMPAGSGPAGNFDIGAFLTEGNQIPEGSALRATQSQTVLPEWYTNYAMDMLANQQALAQRPFPLPPMPRVAEFSPTQQRGFEMTGQAATAFQPALGQATQATQQALASPGGLGAAQPFLSQAGQTSVANIDQYMNPFQEQVVDRIGQLGARNLSERLLPEVEGRYIAAGQLGFGGREPGMGTPSGMMTDTARAIRDTQEAVLAQQAQALQSGFTEATGLAGTDLNRQANLAGTAGQLGGQDLSRGLAGAEQLAGLGAMGQQLGLTGAGALQQVGGVQQSQAQRNLDVAYEDFLRQQNFPQEQIDAMLRTFQGTLPGVPTGQQVFGVEPTGRPADIAPGTGSTIAALLAGAGSIYSGIEDRNARRALEAGRRLIG